MLVVSDDLFPARHWDESLDSILGGLDPQKRDFVVKIRDSPYPQDTGLRHPLVSRKFYEKFGLFDEAFRGVYCDDDITLRAFLFSFIVDGRALAFEHKHPFFGGVIGATASQSKMNDPREYEWGKAVFLQKWPRLHKKLNLNRLSLSRRLTRHTLGSLCRRLVYRLLSSHLPRGGTGALEARSTISYWSLGKTER
jgi:hypothetical protein